MSDKTTPAGGTDHRLASYIAKALGTADCELLAEAADAYAEQLARAARRFAPEPGGQSLRNSARRLRELVAALRLAADDQYRGDDNAPAVNRRVVVTYRVFPDSEPGAFEGVIKEIRPPGQGPRRAGARFRIEPREPGVPAKLAGWYSDREFEVVAP